MQVIPSDTKVGLDFGYICQSRCLLWLLSKGARIVGHRGNNGTTTDSVGIDSDPVRLHFSYGKNVMSFP